MDVLVVVAAAVALLTAFMQSATYVLTRFFYARGGNPAQLAYLNFMLMGIVSLAVLWPAGIAKVEWSLELAGWLGLESVTFFCGQVCWLAALAKAPGSRLATLYNLKIIFVGVLYSLCFAAPFNRWMAAGLVLAAGAAMLMNGSSRPAGERGRGAAAAWLLLAGAIIFLSWADVGAAGMLKCLGRPGDLGAVLLTVCLGNTAVAVMAAPCWKLARPRRDLVAPALPYIAVCLISIATYFFCISVLDPAFSAVLASTRGLFSLMLGMLLAKLGFTALEPRLSRRQWLWCGVAALLMIAAIVIYACGKF
ncbi:MAG: EamA family transporter [Victivallaceae bacterium]|nr:EamA family transporter [Victivallaceae bacterium]